MPVSWTAMNLRNGFGVECFGYLRVGQASLRQWFLRPVKKLVVSSGLMPRTMRGKRLLKRLVFGSLVPMPAEIDESTGSYVEPTPVPSDVPDRWHKVIYCAARLPE